ncbi:MAG: phosphate acyltransferase PlsX [Clostridia bacterium]|nr:phosphate acyltransferase PlsX [Clostridia bacterium]
MKFIIDAFGGDHAPKEIVMGAVSSVNLLDDVEIILTGDEAKIRAELNDIGYIGDKISIINAPEVITCEEQPTLAIRQKKNSSLVVGLDTLAQREDIDGFISAGSTGAVLAGALFRVGRLDGVLRPAVCPLLPNAKGGKTLLIDSGANVDSKPEYLVQFAVMGSAYMRATFGLEKPRVALISVGVEDEKGNELTKTAFEKLKSMPEINFVGNMEARDMLSGEYDVLVCDGFVGNVALKSTEGAVAFLMQEIKDLIKTGGLRAKIGALFLKKSLKKLKQRIDYTSVGGSPFLGVKKLVIKSHGSSKAKTIYSCVCQARELVLSKTLQTIEKDLEILK